MLKALIVIGTRPDTIKTVPVIRALEKHPDKVKCIVLATAQHRELLDQVLSIFSVVPDFDLNIMQKNQDLYHITTQGLQQMRNVMKETKPDIVIVQGDTTSTFVGALSSFYERIPLAHIEAGLRSHQKYSPFPEEINRRLTDSMTDLCFAPTATAKENLLREGIDSGKIFVTGNTAIDALFMILKEDYQFGDSEIKKVVSSNNRLVLVTAHRRENFNEPLRNICRALREIAHNFSDVEMIYSVHPNPNVSKPVYEMLGNTPRIHLVPPPDYLCFSHLLEKCHLVLTDSGGIQEEAPSLGKPVLVMRKVTERVEGIEAGTAILVGTDRERIVEEASRLLEDSNRYEKMARTVNPYGDGKAGVRIANIIFRFLESPRHKA